MAPKKDSEKIWTVGSRLLCQHGAHAYEAKIIEVTDAEEGKVYTVHYQGWHKRHDEKVTQAESATKFIEFTEENLAIAKEKLNEARNVSGVGAPLSSIKKRKGGLDDDARNSETGSRASTPSDRAASTASDKANNKKSGVKRKADDIGPAPDFPANDNTEWRSEMQFNLPAKLRQILTDDHDAINRQFKIPKLPAKYTIDMIVNDYVKTAGVNEDGQANDQFVMEYSNGLSQADSVHLIQAVLGVKDYFDTMLGFQLLYKFERPQFVEHVDIRPATAVVKASIENDAPNTKRRKTKEQKDIASEVENNGVEKTCPTQLYGLPHLLRMLVRFSSMVKMSPWSDRALHNIQKSVHDFLVFLNKNHSAYFDISRDYETASPEYHKLAFT